VQVLGGAEVRVSPFFLEATAVDEVCMYGESYSGRAQTVVLPPTTTTTTTSSTSISLHSRHHHHHHNNSHNNNHSSSSRWCRTDGESRVSFRRHGVPGMLSLIQTTSTTSLTTLDSSSLRSSLPGECISLLLLVHHH